MTGLELCGMGIFQKSLLLPSDFVEGKKVALLFNEGYFILSTNHFYSTLNQF